MKNLRKLILFISMVLLIGGLNVYAATVGDALEQPEAGWSRYNDSVHSIVYENFTNPRAPQIGSYEDDLSFSTSSNGIIKFKFRGTKLRLMSQASPNRATSHTITIDGIAETYTEKDEAQINTVLVYEKTGLTNAIHEVSIVSGTDGTYRISLDAIDIDVDGELVLWNIPSNLSATPQNTSIALDWDSVPEAESYTILRSTTSSAVDTVIATNITETTYMDNNVAAGVTYYYVVRAVKNGIESEDSNIASAIIENTNVAVLQFKLSTTDIYEYRMTMSDVDNFMNWYIDRSNGTGLPFYSFPDDSNIEPYTKINEYIIHDKIVWFKVKEYLK